MESIVLFKCHGGQGNKSQGHGYEESVSAVCVETTISLPPSRMHPKWVKQNCETLPLSELRRDLTTDRRATIPFDWQTAMRGEVQMESQWLLEHQGECHPHVYQKRNVEGLVMRCGAATGRLGSFPDWMEVHETIQAPSRNAATTTNYHYHKAIQN